jgi:hypothetical protein
MTTSLPVAGHAAPSTGATLTGPESPPPPLDVEPPASSRVGVDPLDAPPPLELLDELELLLAPSPGAPPLDGVVEEPPQASKTARDAAQVTPRVRRVRRGECELIETRPFRFGRRRGAGGGRRGYDHWSPLWLHEPGNGIANFG